MNEELFVKDLHEFKCQDIVTRKAIGTVLWRGIFDFVAGNISLSIKRKTLKRRMVV